jgi:hypothetical protein
VIVYHPVHFQIFNRNHTISVDNAPAVLVREIVPAPPNSLMHTSHNFTPLSAFGRTLRLLGEKALRFSQSLFLHPEEAGVLNLLSGRESSERLETNINTDLFIGHGQRRGFPVARDCGVPLPVLLLLMHTVLGVPERGRCNTTFTGPTFDR